MADFYVSSVDGNNSTTPSVSWWSGSQNTYATVAGALGASAAGDRIFVDDAHSESNAALTWNSPGTAAAPVQILGVDRDVGSLVSTPTGQVATTTGGDLTFTGFVYCYGLVFVAGSSTGAAQMTWTSTNPWWYKFENCKIIHGGTNVLTRMTVGNLSSPDDQLLELVNTSVKFSSTSQYLDWRSSVYWIGGSIDPTGSLPTYLFADAGQVSAGGRIVVRGVDLSALGSGQTIVQGTYPSYIEYSFTNCKYDNAVTFVSGAIPGQGGCRVELINCASNDSNYNYYKQTYQGVVQSETTIVRTGGASDGVTVFSRKMTSSANTQFYSPLELDISRWFPSSADLEASMGVETPVTVTCEIVNDGTTLTDGEVWLEVEYLNDTAYPTSAFASDSKSNILASATNQTSSSVDWTTTGLTSPVKQKLSVTFTPEMRGLLRAKVKLARPSTTIYVCPKLELSA